MISAVFSKILPGNRRIISVKDIFLGKYITVYILNIDGILSRLIKRLLGSIGGGNKLAVQIYLVSDNLVTSAIARQLDKFIRAFLDVTFKV